jgi:hypothetical protein
MMQARLGGKWLRGPGGFLVGARAWVLVTHNLARQGKVGRGTPIRKEPMAATAAAGVEGTAGNAVPSIKAPAIQLAAVPQGGHAGLRYRTGQPTGSPRKPQKRGVAVRPERRGGREVPGAQKRARRRLARRVQPCLKASGHRDAAGPCPRNRPVGRVGRSSVSACACRRCGSAPPAPRRPSSRRS